MNAAINNQERCTAIHLFSTLLLVIINYKILFSDGENDKRKELPGTSGRGTPVQDKTVRELAKLNKQLADMLSPKQSGLSLVTGKIVKQLKGRIQYLEMNPNRQICHLISDTTLLLIYHFCIRLVNEKQLQVVAWQHTVWYKNSTLRCYNTEDFTSMIILTMREEIKWFRLWLHYY